MKKAVFAIIFVLALSIAPLMLAERGINYVRINPYGHEETDIDTVEWFLHKDGNYYIFLPADFDIKNAKIYISASHTVFLRGGKIENDSLFSEDFGKIGDFSLHCGRKTYNLRFVQSKNIPSVFIATESGNLNHVHEDKDNREAGGIRIYENGKNTLDEALEQIKGRGNSTWSFPKKPYKIKFDKKTEILGMPKAKKWTLIANWINNSLTRNIYGWEFASAFGLPNTGRYRYIDLYINGEYLGNYVICEGVEIAENRIDINDLEKANEKANPGLDIESLANVITGKNGEILSDSSKGSRKWVDIPNDPDDISGGYILEYDLGARYDSEPSGFITSNGQPIVIKSPEFASRAEVNYIADFVDAGTRALYSETGYNEEGKHYSEYFDVDSLAGIYIVQEISMNYDAALSSFFAYKAEHSDKLVFGPIWDMDNAFGSSQTNMSVPLATADLWWADQMGNNGIPTVLAAAMRHSDFRAVVRLKWAEAEKSGVFDEVDRNVEALVDSIRESAAMNGIRWHFFNTRSFSGVVSKWENTVNESRNFVFARKAMLSKGFGPKGAYLYYDMNSPRSGNWASVSQIREIGETITVRSISGNGTIVPPKGKTFRSWNTKADGSGKEYLPGDTLTLSGEETVLYAIWKTREDGDPDVRRKNELPDELCRWCGRIHDESFVEALKMHVHKLIAALFGEKY